MVKKVVKKTTKKTVKKVARKTARKSAQSTKKVSALGEFGLIHHLTKNIPGDESVICGVGDDCAVLKLGWTLYELFATDMLIEDVHFSRKKISARDIGYKALARNISDIAAMGGEPTHAVIAIALPKTLPVSYATEIYAGLKRCAHTYGMSIVGGDTARSSKITIAVSILGEVEKKHVTYRNGAREGDVIFTTGTFGGSLIKKHATFKPRVAEARFLVSQVPVTAMIDVSDGLVQDLEHIVTASKVGCIIEEANIPVSRDAMTQARGNRKKALQAAMHDGEDFELLFTVPEKYGARLQKKWAKTFKLPLRAIGRITAGGGMRIRNEETGKETLLKSKGYKHF